MDRTTRGKRGFEQSELVKLRIAPDTVEADPLPAALYALSAAFDRVEAVLNHRADTWATEWLSIAAKDIRTAIECAWCDCEPHHQPSRGAV